MKALTLTAPYGTLIAIEAKRIETRSWATKYRGPLAIHQALGLGPVGGMRGLAERVDSEPFFRAFVQSGLAQRHSDPEDIIQELPLGAIVAVAELVDCVQVLYEWPRNQVVSSRTRHVLSDQERAFGDYTPGRYAWLLADIRALDVPIPMRGYQGIWNVPEATEAQIAAQLGKAVLR